MQLIKRLRDVRQRERGAIAIITALSMVALCVVAGMVVDLGLLRVDRQSDQSAADAAATAGANGLVPDLTNPILYPFAGVCQALHYLQANDPDFKTLSSSTWYKGDGTLLGSDGCASTWATNPCTPATPSSWAKFVGKSADGKSQVIIQSGYTFTNSGFAQDTDPVFASDGTARGGCDQLAVILSVTRNTTLGRPAASSMGTTVRSVARVTFSPPVSPYALLILERHNCQVISNGNNGLAAIDVLGYGSHPGMIHSDSDGQGTGCNKPILVGQKASGIVAHEAPDTGAAGRISTVATSNQSDGITNVYSGPSPNSGPVTANMATRAVVDKVYLAGVRNAVSTAAPAWAAIAAGTAPSASFGSALGAWTVLSGCPSGSVSGTKIFIKNCANMNNSATFPNATDIIFPGTVGGGSSAIKMPLAQNVYVAGDPSTNGTGASPGTELSMHDNGAACPSAATPSASRAKLIVYAGALTVGGGMFRACNTTVILMSNNADACLPTTNGTYYDNGLVCNGLTRQGSGVVNMTGSGTVDWTAPDLDDDNSPASDTDHYNLEDLALWDESSRTQGLGGSGTVHLAGVFAAPNANPLKLNGNPTWSVLNSQYVVRTLENDGGGVFTMQPSPTLPIAPPNLSFGLVR